MYSEIYLSRYKVNKYMFVHKKIQNLENITIKIENFTEKWSHRKL